MEKTRQADLLLGPVGEEQTNLIFGKILNSLKNGREFIVLVPTSQVKRAVSRRLLRESPGWLGDRVQTLHEFVYGISDTKFGSQVRELLWWMLAMQDLPANSPLGRIKNFPNTISAVSIAVRELAQADISHDAFEKFSIKKPLLKQLSSLYRGAIDAEIIPLQSAIRRAIAVLDNGEGGARFDDVFVTGFLYFHPTQLLLLNALWRACENLTITLPYEEVRPNIYKLTEDSLPLLPPHRKFLISRSKFIEDSKLSLIEGGTIAEEVASQLILIKNKLVAGLDPGSVAILLREPFRYRSLIMRGAKEYGVPISGEIAHQYIASVWLRRARALLPVSGTIDSFITTAERLIEETKSKDQILWRELRSTLEELIVHLDDVRSVNIELREWESLWNAQRKEREKFQASAITGGVSLLDLEQPHWGGYEVVSIPGLIEHWIPKPPPNPPLLSYSLREEINRFLGSGESGNGALWLANQYRVREELLFTIATDRSSSEIILSHPINSDTTKSIQKSHLLKELLDLHPSVERISPNIKESTPRKIIGSILNDESRDISTEAVNYIKKEHSQLLKDLSRRVDVERDRIAGVGKYNGDVGDKLLLDALINKPLKEGKGISITSLERYGQCPFRYFSRDVLRLPETEDIVEGLSPLAAGSILHQILHRFYEKRIQRGERKISPENMEAAIVEMEEATRAVLEEKWELSKTIHPLLWAEEGASLYQLLREVIKKEAEFYTKSPRHPWLLEYSFSFPIILDDLNEIKLTGQIDRIDETEDKDLFLIDYKRGKYVPAISGIENGTNLQLPLYVNASSTLFNRKVSGGAYFALSDQELKGTIPSRSVGVEEAVERSVKWAKEYIESIRRGYFPVKPKECRGDDCAFHRTCRVNRLQ